MTKGAAFVLIGFFALVFMQSTDAVAFLLLCCLVGALIYD
jgi:hypothetical protein